MVAISYIVVTVFLTLVEESCQQLSQNKDELLNWCLKGHNHKHRPGKEDSLHDQCLPWKDHACCTKEVTTEMHESNMYNFTLNHCYAQTKRNVSDKCRKYFNRNNCFYECEPHIGLWVAQVGRRIASERFVDVPLCASDCKAWFSACKKDFTCAYNWPFDFNFTQGHNTCKEKSQCTTFENMYTTAKEFCENVWDHSWVYTEDDKPCMRLQFNHAEDNPNRKVAEHYIDLRLGSGRAAALVLSLWLKVVGLFICFCGIRNNL